MKAKTFINKLESLANELALELMDETIMRYRLKVDKGIELTSEIQFTMVQSKNPKLPIVSLFRGEIEENENCEILFFMGLNSINRIFVTIVNDEKVGTHDFEWLVQYNKSESIIDISSQYRSIMSSMLNYILNTNIFEYSLTEEEVLKCIWYKENATTKKTATKTTTKKKAIKKI